MQKSLNLQWLYAFVAGFTNPALRRCDTCSLHATVVRRGPACRFWDKITGWAFASTPRLNLMLRIGRKEGDLDR
jgi:hypothetical protein